MVAVRPVRNNLRTYALPLVMMNACGADRMRAPGAPSFPYLLLPTRFGRHFLQRLAGAESVEAGESDPARDTTTGFNWDL